MAVKLEFRVPYLHAVLELSHERVAGDEFEKATLHLEGHGHNEGKEEQHLEHEKCEDLNTEVSISLYTPTNDYVCGPVRISDSWCLIVILLDVRRLCLGRMPLDRFDVVEGKEEGLDGERLGTYKRVVERHLDY